jgi:hypothetical protein
MTSPTAVHDAPMRVRTVIGFAVISVPLLTLAAILGGWLAALLAGMVVALIAAALVDPG